MANVLIVCAGALGMMFSAVWAFLVGASLTELLLAHFLCSSGVVFVGLCVLGRSKRA